MVGKEDREKENRENGASERGRSNNRSKEKSVSGKCIGKSVVKKKEKMVLPTCSYKIKLN